MTRNATPPGWEPHRIIHRIDGWVIDPQHEYRVPAAVAEMIAPGMPQPGDRAVAAIRARMLARHRKVLGNV